MPVGEHRDARDQPRDADALARKLLSHRLFLPAAERLLPSDSIAAPAKLAPRSGRREPMTFRVSSTPCSQSRLCGLVAVTSSARRCAATIPIIPARKKKHTMTRARGRTNRRSSRATAPIATTTGIAQMRSFITLNCTRALGFGPSTGLPPRDLRILPCGRHYPWPPSGVVLN